MSIKAKATRFVQSRPRAAAAALLAAGFAIALFVWLGRDRAPMFPLGIEQQFGVTLPGPQRKAVPFHYEDAVALRIEKITPRGKGFHYELRFILNAPGQFDLADYFIEEDGAKATGLPPIRVSGKSILPEDFDGTLYEAFLPGIDVSTGYVTQMTLAWTLWALLLLPLIFLGRKRETGADSQAATPTTEQLLRELLSKASQNGLSREERGRMELLFLRYCREKHDVESANMEDAVARLRRHPEAGRGFAALEAWLHRARPADERDALAQLRACMDALEPAPAAPAPTTAIKP